MAATSVHDDVFLDSEEFHEPETDCADVDVNPLVRRAQEVTKWQQKYRVDWDATDDRNGGAHQRILEILLEMGRFDESLGRRSRSFGLGLGLCKRLRPGQSSCGVGLGDALQLPTEDLTSVVQVF